MRNLLDWIWLSLSCTIGSDTFKKLITSFGTAENIYAADEDAILSCLGSKSKDIESLTDKSLERAEAILEFCRKKNVGILTYDDDAFPPLLKKIATPPVLLYYRGVLPDFKNEFAISVVGTRKISDYGRRNAFSVSRDLAKAGALIVSGMAMGIDGIALAAALSEGKSTVAVIGSGIDVCYPPQHQYLAREIVKNGCVFTEYPPGTPPDGYNFPKRNRIISGLSVATVVIEGPERSGSVITARYSREEGKTVFALPGNVDNRNSEAPNILLRNGAKPFLKADDIIRDLEPVSAAHLNPFKLLEPSSRDMLSVLKGYRVVAVAPNDPIFRNKPTKKKDPTAKAEIKETVSPQDAENKVISFDKESLVIYKKIPADQECSIESLVDESHSLRDVMRLLLKLEMACFVTILPGEKVRRNLNN